MGGDLMNIYKDLTADVNYSIRIPKQLREDFKEICQNKLLNPSAVMRDFMIRFIEEHKK